MGQNFAGIMGFAAFLAVVARGCVHDSSIESTIRLSLMGLFAFAEVGLVIGQIADHTICHTVRRDFQERLQASRRAAATSEPNG